MGTSTVLTASVSAGCFFRMQSTTHAGSGTVTELAARWYGGGAPFRAALEALPRTGPKESVVCIPVFCSVAYVSAQKHNTKECAFLQQLSSIKELTSIICFELVADEVHDAVHFKTDHLGLQFCETWVLELLFLQQRLVAFCAAGLSNRRRVFG